MKIRLKPKFKTFLFILIPVVTVLLIYLVYSNSNFDYEYDEELGEYVIINPKAGIHNFQPSFNINFDDTSNHYAENKKKIQEYEDQFDQEYFESQNITEPIIIWWTPFTLDLGSYKKCGKNKCFFTNVRKFRGHNQTKAFVFYGTDFRLYDLPLPRRPHEEWALMHEESPKNNYLFSFDSVMRMFNHTATFKRESDFTLLTQYLTSIEDLTSRKYQVPTKEKNRLQKEDLKLAPVAYIQSDCNTPSDRDIYVEALMKHIKVDSYGKCLHNKDLPEDLRASVKTMGSAEFYKIIANYKFVLAMENAVCDDYVTEKLWRSFYIGSVPIVYGSSKIREILPDNNSAILVTDFPKGAQELAEYLHRLNDNDEEYEKFLEYKNGVKNEELVKLVKEREWRSIFNQNTDGNSFIDSFQCFICNRLHTDMMLQKAGKTPRKRQASKDHYGCPIPYTFNKEGQVIDEKYMNDTEKWIDSSHKFSYEVSNCEQKIFFDQFIKSEIYNFTAIDLRSRAHDLYHRIRRNESNRHSLRFDL